MSLDQLLARLARHGVELRAAGNDLRYRPVDALTPALLDEVRRHKHAILAHLAADDPAVAWRAAAMRARHACAPDESWPFLTVRDMPRGACGCCSCGVPVEPYGDGPAVRCTPCMLAAWLVTGVHLDRAVQSQRCDNDTERRA